MENEPTPAPPAPPAPAASPAHIMSSQDNPICWTCGKNSSEVKFPLYKEDKPRMRKRCCVACKLNAKRLLMRNWCKAHPEKLAQAHTKFIAKRKAEVAAGTFQPTKSKSNSKSYNSKFDVELEAQDCRCVGLRQPMIEASYHDPIYWLNKFGIEIPKRRKGVNTEVAQAEKDAYIKDKFSELLESDAFWETENETEDRPRNSASDVEAALGAASQGDGDEAGDLQDWLPDSSEVQ